MYISYKLRYIQTDFIGLHKILETFDYQLLKDVTTRTKKDRYNKLINKFVEIFFTFTTGKAEKP